MTGKPVFWDAYGLASRNSGVFVHANQLIHELKPLGVVPTLIGYSGFAQYFSGWPTHEFASSSRIGTKIYTSKLLAPKAVARYVAKQATQANQEIILHGLSNLNLGLAARVSKIRGVLTVHDLIPILAAINDVSLVSRLQFQWLFTGATSRADCIICVSEWTKQTLLDRYPRLAAKKIVVIPNGFPAVDLESADDGGVAAANVVRAVSVARYEKYKHLDLLCDIVRKARGSIVLSLVTDDKGARFVKEYAADLLLAQAIKVFSLQTSEQLKRLYKQADILLHTSRYEGFCLPAAEALSCSVPVVYQGGSGIDEVVGNIVGTGMGAEDATDAWVQSAHAWLGKKQDSTFKAALEKHLQRMKRWKEVASELKSVYETL